MRNRMGITQWTVPWKGKELCSRAESMGISVLHLDLGSAAKGYPMTKRENREEWLEGAANYHLQIVSLALNDLGNHGFTAGLWDVHSQIALTTLRYGVEIANAMGIPSISVPHFFDNRIVDEHTLHFSAQALRYLCDLAAEHGIMIYTENVLDHARLQQLWEEVDRENLRLLFDTQNYSAMAGLDAREIFLHWQKHCGSYIHLKDGDAPSLGNQHLWQGTSGFEEVFSAVLNSGYSGDVILESNYADEDSLQGDVAAVCSRLSTNIQEVE